MESSGSNRKLLLDRSAAGIQDQDTNLSRSATGLGMSRSATGLGMSQRSFSRQSRIEEPLYTTEENRKILFVAYSVLFTRYCIATFLSPFFPLKATELGISNGMNGLIFASYPFGITVTSAFGAKLIVAMGIRKAVAIGCLLTFIFTIAFGLVPIFITTTSNQQYGFLFTYFLSGLGGALAETACIIIVASRFSDRIGTVMASVGTVCGLGCMAGPPIGGVLYDLGSTDEWKFRIPFLVFGTLPLVLVPAVVRYMPGQSIDDSKEGGSLWSVMSPSLVLTTIAIALSGTVVATLDPTLADRLGAAPLNMNTTKIGLMFMISSVSYVAR
jgi:MFS family permease